jgi:hypothetical protein
MAQRRGKKGLVKKMEAYNNSNSNTFEMVEGMSRLPAQAALVLC